MAIILKGMSEVNDLLENLTEVLAGFRDQYFTYPCLFLLTINLKSHAECLVILNLIFSTTDILLCINVNIFESKMYGDI